MSRLEMLDLAVRDSLLRQKELGEQYLQLEHRLQELSPTPVPELPSSPTETDRLLGLPD